MVQERNLLHRKQREREINEGNVLKTIQHEQTVTKRFLQMFRSKQGTEYYPSSQGLGGVQFIDQDFQRLPTSRKTHPSYSGTAWIHRIRGMRFIIKPREFYLSDLNSGENHGISVLQFWLADKVKFEFKFA